jgi:hypothetical protein
LAHESKGTPFARANGSQGAASAVVEPPSVLAIFVQVPLLPVPVGTQVAPSAQIPLDAQGFRLHAPTTFTATGVAQVVPHMRVWPVGHRAAPHAP